MHKRDSENHYEKTKQFYINLLKVLCEKLQLENTNGDMYMPDQMIFSMRDKICTRLENPLKLMKLPHEKAMKRQQVLKRESQQLKLVKEQNKQSTKKQTEQSKVMQRRDSQFDDELFQKSSGKILFQNEPKVEQQSNQQISENQAQQDKDYETKRKCIEKANQTKDIVIIGTFQSNKKTYIPKSEKTKMNLDMLVVKTPLGQKWYSKMNCEFTTMNKKEIQKI